MPAKKKQTSEAAVREIRRRTRRRFSAEEKIRIVLEGLRGEVSVAELCRREGIASNLYYRWSKEFLEAGKKRLAVGLSFTGAIIALLLVVWLASPGSLGY
jgi:transposase